MDGMTSLYDLRSSFVGKNGTKVGNGRKPFSSKLEEIVMEDEGEKLVSDEYAGPEDNWAPNISKLSVSMRNTNFGEKSWQHQGVKQKTGCLASTSSGNRSVNELPESSSFVKLSDMDEEKWNQFLENFQRLLNPAFVSRKRRLVGQRQRLGTSCQF